MLEASPCNDFSLLSVNVNTLHLNGKTLVVNRIYVQIIVKEIMWTCLSFITF